MDFVVENLLKGFVRGLGYVLGEIIAKLVFYYSAAFFFRAISLGKYPTNLHQEPFDSPSSLLLTAAGAIFYVFLGVYLVSNYG